MPRPIPGSGNRRQVVSTALVASLLLTFSPYPSVRPAYSAVGIGGGTGDFLEFEVGGRSAGMGGAQVGSASGVTAQFWNPAGLAGLDRPEIGAMHATWLDDLNYEWLGYARPLGGNLGVGSASLAYFHMPSLQGLDEFGNPTEEFKAYDMALTVGLARPLGHGVSFGANAKLIRQTLATVSATGAAVDLGASATYAGTTFGAVVQNLGPDLSFGGASYPLSRQIRLGVSREFVDGRLLLASDYNMPSDYYDDARVGAEFRAHPNISVRLGYRREFGTSSDPADGLSYGLGIHFRQLNVDYAMTANDEFSDIHRLSFGYSFGGGAGEKEPKQPKPEETKPAPPAPTGPPVIAQAKPSEPAPTKTPPPAPPKAAAKSGPVAEPKASSPAPSSSRETGLAEGAAPAPKAAPVEYIVVLPAYPSKESAQAEMKALELLGFRTKDAHIVRDTKRGGYMIAFGRLKSKSNAKEVAASLQRMSFRAVVEVAER